MLQNTNPETGIRYGIIAANNLHPEVVDNLQFGAQARDVHFEEAQQEVRDVIKSSLSDWFSSRAIARITDTALEEFSDDFQDEEPVHEGTLDGVKYRTTWLGGALMVWVFESPHLTKARLCSPCVQNCGDLDSPWVNGYECYDVPADWRDAE